MEFKYKYKAGYALRDPLFIGLLNKGDLRMTMKVLLTILAEPTAALLTLLVRSMFGSLT